MVIRSLGLPTARSPGEQGEYNILITNHESSRTTLLGGKVHAAWFLLYVGSVAHLATCHF